MNQRVFVYGALRKGALHAWRMEKACFVGEATVAGTLMKVDWYPGLVLNGAGDVKGEVYEVGPALLEELDIFEGIAPENERNGEYHRIKAEVTLANGDHCECLIYEWLKGVEDYEVVANGDWLTVEH
jgi:gamma-glutamylcyclotransferase (GGCT)/AIG2-like uncharacterized protein YtfP